ncbi:zinc finger MYM-type protein 6 [Trichonephila clavipes]|nr:zinc finger MYM-type protein 6 [Trichonephila clavipes]
MAQLSPTNVIRAKGVGSPRSEPKKPLTIGEQSVHPCMLKDCEQILIMQAVQKLKVIPMSDNTINHRIEDMAEDIENQIIKIVKNSSTYSIQLDKSKDITNKAFLLCFMWFEYEGELYEELLCSLNLPGKTASSEIFEALNSFFREREIDWKKFIGICTKGVANVTGHLS